MLQSLNPYNQELIGEYKQLEVEELDPILSLSSRGFEHWSNISLDERAEYLRKISKDLRENKEEYATLISQEMGKVIKASRKEVDKSAMALEFFAEHAFSYLHQKQIQEDEGEAEVVYEPMGVILSVMPWNYPFWQFFRFAATTLMAGNSILLKHSSQVPACSEKIAQIFQKAGFPKGVFQNIITSSSNINNILKDFRVQGVSLTGSVEAGASVAKHAGKNIKKTVLELGGSDPYIVMEDADIKKAVKAGAKSRMKNFGQSCDAAKRFILHQDIAEEFLEEMKNELEKKIFGNPLHEDSDYASLVNKEQKQLLDQQVEDSLKEGAEIYWQEMKAPEENAFFNPIILRNIAPHSPAYSQELFGPVVSVFEVENQHQAIEIANDTEFGLGASIWTNDLERGKRMARQVDAGIVYVNHEVHSKPELPFGGVKKSGIGREMAGEGSREFTHKKSLWYNVNT
ncbi:MAG: NAD-dependent succinate-semialdehyde dehydrogenase [Bacteroidota bacterium]